MITLQDMINEVRTEIALREKVFPRLVQSGRMKREAADKRQALMKAVLDTLVKLSEGGHVVS
jgi:hypothetical protein